MSDLNLNARIDALERTPVPWESGHWHNEPAAMRADGSDLLVTARESSDAWSRTAYGFVRASAHALLAPLPEGCACEVTLLADFEGTFDQAGIFVSVDDETWLKAGLEFADGVLGLGSVATRGESDWSTGPVPQWAGRLVTVRISRAVGALAVRAKVEGEEFRLVRLAPLASDATALAGPYCAAPTRAGLTVRFTAWTATPADDAIH